MMRIDGNMVRNLLLAVLCLWAVAATAQPKGQWLSTKHDFGTINENDGDATCSMYLVNTGDEPLVIVKARASCGCTRPRYSKDPIAPGDTAEIVVAYDPVGRPGRFSKKIYFDTNGSELRSMLTISGVVIASDRTIKVRYPVDAGPLKLRNRMMAMGDIKHGKAKSAFLDAYNQSADTLRLQWDNVPEYLSVMTAPKAIPPGEQATISFYFNTFKCDKWGLVSDVITMIPSAGSDSVQIEVTAMVEEDFSKMTPGQRMNAPAIAITPERLDFGLIDESAGVVTKEFVVENFGKDALVLRRVYTVDHGISVEVDKEKIKKGKTARIKVSVDPSKIKNEILNARISVIANDPQRPVTVVRAVGEMKP